MRLLILVPIIHTEADLGSLRESVRRSHIERTGTEQWDRRRVAVADLWRTIQSQIDGLQLDYARVRSTRTVCRLADVRMRSFAISPYAIA